MFIPIIFYLATAETRNPQLYSRIGNSVPYAFRNPQHRMNPIDLFDLNSQFSVIPQQESKPDEQLTYIYLNDWTGPAGFLQTGWRDEYQETIALNYSNIESEMEFYSINELEEIVEGYGLNYISFQKSIDPTDPIESSTKHSTSTNLPLSKIILLVVLSLIIFESLIYRLKS